MSADFYSTTDSLSFFFLSFFRRLISELVERNRNQNRPHVGSNCDLKRMSKICDISSPHKSVAKNHLLCRLRNLTANLTAYRPIFGTKHHIDNRSSALTITRDLLHRLKCHELWPTKGLKLDLHYPPSVNSALYVIARLCRRRSANRTQPNFAKRRMVNRANNLL